MGRYAQQRKRGGHVGEAPGLPAGPVNSSWTVEEGDTNPQVRWISPDPSPFDFFRSRWRRPALSMLWTLSGDDAQPTAEDITQSSPFAKVALQQQDCEVIYCDVAGNPLSQWSAYQSIA
jgi:hypothetical protein